MPTFVILPTAPYSPRGGTQQAPTREVLVNLDRIVTVEAWADHEGWAFVTIDSCWERKLSVPMTCEQTCMLIRRAAGEPVVPIGPITNRS